MDRQIPHASQYNSVQEIYAPLQTKMMIQLHYNQRVKMESMIKLLDY